MASQRQITGDSTAAREINQRDAIVNFLSLKGLTPTSTWMNEFMQQTRTNIPLSSLQQTALYRLLATDLTLTSQRTSNLLPSEISNPSIVEQRIPGPIVVQLLDIEDIGRSSWSQIEVIESQERGETTRGNQVIRTLPEENGENSTVRSKGPHKLLLQDPAGTKMYAFEAKSIDRIEIGCSIGLKIILRGFTVARGLALLDSSSATVLGGKIDVLDQSWQASRKGRLLQKVQDGDQP